MNIFKRLSIVLLALVLLAGCHPSLIKRKPIYSYKGMTKQQIRIHKKVEKFIQKATVSGQPIVIYPGTRIDSIVVNNRQRMIGIYMNKRFSYVPFRTVQVKQIYQILHSMLGRKYRKYDLTVYSMQIPIEELVPNFFRADTSQYDTKRLPKPHVRPLAVKRPQIPFKITRGLQDRNIVVWNSHGWYYNHKNGRWEWQRPRLFQTVEDLLPTSFVIPYLLPMLENAGANVFLPRERDFQSHEVIVDNDSTPPNGSHYAEYTMDNRHFFKPGKSAGFAFGHPPYPSGLNPFLLGSYRQVQSDSVVSARVSWMPVIPETGFYAVYVSYHADSQNVQDAHYTVLHTGGKTTFKVNQQIGGSTWLYLGTFKFKKGLHPDSGSVQLTNQSAQPGKWVTADAVRFGGGMGSIEREGITSGRPRWEEGARYYLQYTGMPDTLVYNLNNDKNDYVDDYQSRPEYVNYLYGKPFGPNKNRDVKGLGIPIDLSLAFHTDAGFYKGDTTVGTLLIYSLTGADTLRIFPDSVSRLANRDFADILQTQVVSDIRATFDSTWQRRALHEAQYSETYRPNVPAAIMELLSHQNFRDMQLGLDPRFRFTVARAVYKGMLKFIASEHKQPYVVQPLPVTHFSAVFDSTGRIVLNWQPQTDPLEPSARPDRYIVYTRIDSGGFNNGTVVSQPAAVIDTLAPGKIYSFKVCALNAGGKSFPSEILSVYRAPNSSPAILIINGFDRICGPTYFRADSIGGFASFEDSGEPDHYDLSFTGMQYDFKIPSVFRGNDAPGFGASYADFETKVIPGNTFDFVFRHGVALKNAGISFCSSSDEAITDNLISIDSYPAIDLILGEEKTTPWPQEHIKAKNDSIFKAFPVRLQRIIKRYLQQGNGLFVSGAYVGEDLFNGKKPDSPDVRFGLHTLHINWQNTHASRTGVVQHDHRDSLLIVPPFRFNTGYTPHIYTVEAPDAINPAGNARTWLRYVENGQSAATLYSGKGRLVVMGFPFETILKPEVRTALMEQVMRFLLKKP